MAWAEGSTAATWVAPSTVLSATLRSSAANDNCSTLCSAISLTSIEYEMGAASAADAASGPEKASMAEATVAAARRASSCCWKF